MATNKKPDPGDPVVGDPVVHDPLIDTSLAGTPAKSASDFQADAQGVIRGATPRYPSPTGEGVVRTPTPPAKTYPRMKVRAIADGYYDDVLRRVGDVFTISGDPLEDIVEREVVNMPPLSVSALPNPATLTKRQQMQAAALDKRTSQIDAAGVQRPAAFSAKWMEPVDEQTPERVTSHNAVLRQQHDELIRERAGGQPPTGNQDVLGQ